jgi:hypothetical protein
MRGWIRLGLIVTALWVAASIVTVIYLGAAPSWREARDRAFAEWHRQIVETETGRALAEWDLQVRVERQTCFDALAKKSISAERQAELCNISPLYAQPEKLDWMGIYARAIPRYIADWFHEFLFPIAVWAFFVPFCLWFTGVAGALLVLRLRGDRPRTAERPNRLIH